MTESHLHGMRGNTVLGGTYTNLSWRFWDYSQWTKY